MQQSIKSCLLRLLRPDSLFLLTLVGGLPTWTPHFGLCLAQQQKEGLQTRQPGRATVEEARGKAGMGVGH